MIEEMASGTTVHKIEGRSVLVLVTRPAEEVVGCIGAIMRHLDAGDAVQVLVAMVEAPPVVDLAGVDKCQPLWSVSSRVAKMLGYGEPKCMELPHRHAVYSEDLVQYLERLLEKHQADLVYSPSIYEKDADHHALALAAAEAVRRRAGALKLAMYPLETPFPENTAVLLDCTGLEKRKEEVTALLASLHEGFHKHPQLDPREEYLVARADSLSRDSLGIFPPGYWRQPSCLISAAFPDQPKVSVIVRSVDRPYLQDALDSVALQTYPNLEVVVIDARALSHSVLGSSCGRFPMSVVDTGANLQRSRAANAGLEKADGDYILFLDDDDWIAPHHIAELVGVLQANRDVKVAYAGVAVHDEQRREMDVSPFNADFNVGRLRGGNYIPIHAMVFARSSLQHGVRFDESFVVYEDWDFILQLAQLTSFLHVDRVSAYYRSSGTSGVGIHADVSLQRKSRARIFEKWTRVWSGEQIDEMIQSAISTEQANIFGHQEQLTKDLNEAHLALTDVHEKLDATHSKLKSLHQAHEAVNEELMKSQSELAQFSLRLDRANTELKLSENRLQETERVISHLELQVAEKTLHLEIANGRIYDMLHSSSWRVSAPIRWMGAARVHAKQRALRAITSVLGRNTWPSGLPVVSQGFHGEEISLPAPTGKGPLVSVIMPVYNACRADKRYLLRAIESIANQTYKNVELIVVNDGSTDDTELVCQEYLARYTTLRFKLLSKKNGGQSEARNFGAKACSGDYIGFLDQDDEWYENKLEQISPWLDNQNIDVIYTDSDSIDGDDKVTLGGIHKNHYCGWPHPKKSIEDILFKDVFVMPGLMTIKKSAFDRIGGFDAKLSGYEDDDLFLRLYESCNVFYLPVPTLRWRMYGDNYSFSHRMLTSRSYYWKKLLHNYADDGGNIYRSQMISLRFFWEFLTQSVTQYLAKSDLCWASLRGAKEIWPYLPRTQRAVFGLLFLMPDRWLLESVVLGKRLLRLR